MKKNKLKLLNPNFKLYAYEEYYKSINNHILSFQYLYLTKNLLLICIMAS